MTSAWVVTSSAVVGSSASSSRGLVSSAAAIMTRCSIPPDIWCGYWRIRLAPSSMPTWVSMSTARSRACAARTPWLVRSASVRKSPMRRTGLMCARGSWKIIATWVRYRRRSAPVSPPTSLPANRIEPWTWAPAGSRRPIARAVMVLPGPGLTHQAHGLARCHNERDIPQHGPRAAIDFQHYAQSGHLQQRRAGRGPGGPYRAGLCRVTHLRAA